MDYSNNERRRAPAPVRVEHHHYIHFVEPDLNEVNERLDELEAKLDALVGDDPAVQAAVDALRDKVKVSSDNLAAAVVANAPKP